MTQQNMLIIDDDAELRQLLTEFFSTHHFQVTALPDGEKLEEVLKTTVFDIVILDIILPNTDGFTLCKKIREKSSVPIIMLTAMENDHDKIIGLELGADDYLTKPFNSRELLARIKAIFRRTAQNETTTSSQNYEFEQWRLEKRTRRLFDPTGIEIVLSSGEFELLLLLIENAPNVLTRDQLIQTTRNRDAGPYDRTIDVQISRLRQKLEKDPKNPTFIKTIRSGGYAFVAAVNRKK